MKKKSVYFTVLLFGMMLTTQARSECSAGPCGDGSSCSASSSVGLAESCSCAWYDVWTGEPSNVNGGGSTTAICTVGILMSSDGTPPRAPAGFYAKEAEGSVFGVRRIR